MVAAKCNILSNGASYAWQKSNQILFYIKIWLVCVWNYKLVEVNTAAWRVHEDDEASLLIDFFPAKWQHAWEMYKKNLYSAVAFFTQHFFFRETLPCTDMSPAPLNGKAMFILRH